MDDPKKLPSRVPPTEIVDDRNDPAQMPRYTQVHLSRSEYIYESKLTMTSEYAQAIVVPAQEQTKQAEEATKQSRQMSLRLGMVLGVVVLAMWLLREQMGAASVAVIIVAAALMTPLERLVGRATETKRLPPK